MERNGTADRRQPPDWRRGRTNKRVERQCSQPFSPLPGLPGGDDGGVDGGGGEEGPFHVNGATEVRKRTCVRLRTGDIALRSRRLAWIQTGIPQTPARGAPSSPFARPSAARGLRNPTPPGVWRFSDRPLLIKRGDVGFGFCEGRNGENYNADSRVNEIRFRRLRRHSISTGVLSIARVNILAPSP